MSGEGREASPDQVDNVTAVMLGHAGFISIITQLVMFSSPIALMRKAVSTGSYVIREINITIRNECIALTPALSYIFIPGVWFKVRYHHHHHHHAQYGYDRGLFVVMMPNALGVVIGCLELGLYMYYNDKTVSKLIGDRESLVQNKEFRDMSFRRSASIELSRTV